MENEATIYGLREQLKVSEELNKKLEELNNKREKMIKIQEELISNLEIENAESEIINKAKNLEIVKLKEKNRILEELILKYEKIKEEMFNSLDNIIENAANGSEE